MAKQTLTPKKVSESRTVMTELIMPNDTNPMGNLMGGYGGCHFLGAGIGYAVVFVTAMAFVLLLPLMVGVLTWCEFSEKVDLGSIRSTTDKALNEVNAKVAEMKEKAQAQAQQPATAPVATSSNSMSQL